jgi:non-specific serine/threonine protein kinase
VERKPDCENAYWTLGQAYFASDRWAEAAALAERAIEVSGADYNVYVPYMMAFERLGQHEAARGVRQRHVRALEQHLDRVPEDVRAHILLADNQAFFGDEEAALRHISIALELRPNDSNILYNAACTYGILGKKSQALAAFTRAVDSGFDALDYAARDPDLECIREDPEFQRALDAGRKPMTVVHP